MFVTDSAPEVHKGFLGGGEHKLYMHIITRDAAFMLREGIIRKSTPHMHKIEYVRKAKLIIECHSIDVDALHFILKHGSVIKSVRGTMFCFGVEGEKEIPDIMPCPFCGYAAHWDEDVYSTDKLHLMCDSGDPGSCGETLIWETVTAKDELEDDCKDFGDEYETK